MFKRSGLQLMWLAAASHLCIDVSSQYWLRNSRKFGDRLNQIQKHTPVIMSTGSLFTVTSSGPVIMWLQNSGCTPPTPCPCQSTNWTHSYMQKTVCVIGGDDRCIFPGRNIYPKSKTNMKEAEMKNELFTTETLVDSLLLRGLCSNFLNV